MWGSFKEVFAETVIDVLVWAGSGPQELFVGIFICLTLGLVAVCTPPRRRNPWA